jgi:hypothetical protein
MWPMADHRGSLRQGFAPRVWSVYGALRAQAGASTGYILNRPPRQKAERRRGYVIIVDVWRLPGSLEPLALRGNRDQIINGGGLAWADVWPLLVIGLVSVPLGLWVFRTGERYAKRHGKLKRSG